MFFSRVFVARCRKSLKPGRNPLYLFGIFVAFPRHRGLIPPVRFITPVFRLPCPVFDAGFCRMTAGALPLRARRRSLLVRLLQESGWQHRNGMTVMSLMLIVMWVFFGLILCLAGTRLGHLLRAAARGCGYFAEPPGKRAADSAGES